MNSFLHNFDKLRRVKHLRFGRRDHFLWKQHIIAYLTTAVVIKKITNENNILIPNSFKTEKLEILVEIMSRRLYL